jgi:ribonuclease HII
LVFAVASEFIQCELTHTVPRKSTRKLSKITRIAEELQISKSAAKLRLLKTLRCTTDYEKKMWLSGAKLVAGVDEVGRGSLFGPVVAGACILDPKYRIRGLRDSKLVPEKDREKLAERIRDHCIAWAVASVDVGRIDQLNIYHASRLAMAQAVAALSIHPDHLLIDALKIDFDCPQTAIIHGDALSASIAAASIVAKVYRDSLMRAWDPVYPVYGLASNKGYYTQKHLKALREFGPSPMHRQSFAPYWSSASAQEMLSFMTDENEEADAVVNEVVISE